MSSVGFLDGTHFVAVSADLTVVIRAVEVAYPGPVIPEQLVLFQIPPEGALGMVPWGSYGNHVFKCGERVYVCVMKRWHGAVMFHDTYINSFTTFEDMITITAPWHHP